MSNRDDSTSYFYDEFSLVHEAIEAVPSSTRRTASTGYTKWPSRDRDYDRRDREKEDTRLGNEDEESDLEWDPRPARVEETAKEREQARKEMRRRHLEPYAKGWYPPLEESRRHREPYVEKLPVGIDKMYLASNPLPSETTATSQSSNFGDLDYDKGWQVGRPAFRPPVAQALADLPNKETISKDNTGACNARLDDLLADMGTKVIKTRYLARHCDDVHVEDERSTALSRRMDSREPWHPGSNEETSRFPWKRSSAFL